MLTTPNMGLKQWDQAGDFFSFSELKLNWDAVDQHDHTTNRGVQIPTAGIANLAVTGAKIATATIDNSKLVPATITDASLVSPMGVAYRNIGFGSATIAGASAGQIYFIGANGTLTAMTANATTSPVLIPFNPTDYAISGKTTRMRIAVAYGTNSISNTATWTFALTSSAPSGASGAISWGLGTNQATVALVSPGFNTAGTVYGADVAPPASGAYLLTASSSLTMPVGAIINFSVYVQIHYV